MRLTIDAFITCSLVLRTQGFSRIPHINSRTYGVNPRNGLFSLGANNNNLKGSNEDCGCPVEYSGKPSSKAKTIANPKLALSDLQIFDLDGKPTSLEQVEFSNQNKVVHIVSFMRSFG